MKALIGIYFTHKDKAMVYARRRNRYEHQFIIIEFQEGFLVVNERQVKGCLR